MAEISALKSVGILKRVELDEKYRVEFNKKTLERNIDREVMLSMVLIGIILLLFAISIANGADNVWGLESFIQFSVLHIVLLIIPCSFLVFNYINKRVKPISYRRQKMAHVLISIAVLIMCAIIGALHGSIMENTYAFSIGSFCISAIILLDSRERIAIFLLPCLTYIITTVVTQSNIIKQFDCIFYLILLSAICYICSTINYNSYVKNFVNNRIILEQNEELNSMYKIAQDTLNEKTEALNKAEQYEKMRTNFFANISHELRTPLTIIFSGQQMLEMILKRADIGKVKNEVFRYMGIINQNCNRLLRIISNLIDITKIDAGYFRVFLGNYDIVRVVEDITLSVAKYIEDRDIKLTFDTQIEEKVIACDPDKIERIMLNLLSNAVKFTPSGGSIYVNIYLKNSKVIIIVKDTGIGIPPLMRDLIFERFIQVDKTTTRNNEGSGIGLCIVKSLVELHNGRIFVISEEGRGSEFVIELPDTTADVKEQQPYRIHMDENSHIQRINVEFSDIYN